MTQNNHVALECAGPICNVLLLLVLFVRRRAASFPILAVYVALDAIVTGAMSYAYLHLRPHTYWSTYFILCILDQTFSTLVVYEISRHVFCPTGVWARDVRKPLIILLIASTAVACLLACLIHPRNPDHFQAFMQRISLFYVVLTMELCLGMTALSSTVGLPWKNHAARIGRAWGVGALFDLIMEMIERSWPASHPTHAFFWFNFVGSAFNSAFVIYLIVVLWPDEPAPQPLPDHIHKQIYTLQQQVENDLTKIRSWRSS